MKRRGFIGLLTGLSMLSLRGLAAAICNPYLVRLLERGQSRLQISGHGEGASTRYFIEWFGHSSFLIHSEARVRIITDPNFNVTPGIEADAVTVSNDHFTHNNVGAVGGNPLILRGISREQTWNPIETRVKDILIVNLPSVRSFDYGQVGNSIFIYEMGSLCIAHLGNIGHLPTPDQERLLRRVDVMMTPIDARLNLGFEDLLTVINRIKPPLVIPMHYDDPAQAEIFSNFIQEYYPVRQKSESRLILSRAALPASTEVLILRHPNPFNSFDSGPSYPDMDTEN